VRGCRFDSYPAVPFCASQKFLDAREITLSRENIDHTAVRFQMLLHNCCVLFQNGTD
jgi:hypothetical protein